MGDEKFEMWLTLCINCKISYKLVSIGAYLAPNTLVFGTIRDFGFDTL